jgi:hypothetical protein
MSPIHLKQVSSGVPISAIARGIFPLRITKQIFSGKLSATVSVDVNGLPAISYLQQAPGHGYATVLVLSC